MRLGCFVSVYNPDDLVISNIRSYLDFFESVWIADNTDKPDPKFLDQLMLVGGNVQYLSNGENLGIAKPLNVVSELAIAQGIEWLLMMDQDSSFSESQINNYVKAIVKLKETKDIALVGIQTKGINYQEDAPSIMPVKTLITSGTFMNLLNYNKVGKYNENLFIYEVDYEYCFRATLVGLKILQISGINMNHQFGSSHLTRSFRSFLLKKRNRSLSAPISLYYHFRNYLWLRKNYISIFPSHFKKADLGMLLHLKNNLFYNVKRLQVLKMVLKAYHDFMNKKMGRFEC